MTIRLFPILLSMSLLACDGKDQGIDSSDTNDDTNGNGNETDTEEEVADDLAGGDIDSAYTVEWEDGQFSVEEIIGEAGDRDFFALELDSGTALAVASYAYALTGSTEPDTVIRLYDESGTLLYENDDMPFRIFETDSALFFEATYTGTYYVEVLEWSDWAADSDGATGGADFEYVLSGVLLDPYEDEPINNDPDDVAEHVAQDGVYAFVGDPFTGGDYTMLMADISSEGDVDYFPWEVPEPTDTPYNGLFYSLNFFGQPLGNLDPIVSIVDADGNVLAQTSEPFYGTDRLNFYGRGFAYDYGAMAYLTPGQYFFKVENADPAVYGDGTFYAGIITGFYDSFAPFENDQDQNQITNGAPLELDPDNFYVTVSNSLGIDGDMLDSWAINVGSVPKSDKYVDIFVIAEQYGSLLDAKVTVYAGDGSTVLAEFGSNDFDGGADPELKGLEVTEDDIFVVVEPDGESGLSEEELANNYILYVSVNDTP